MVKVLVLDFKVIKMIKFVMKLENKILIYLELGYFILVLVFYF